MLGQRFGPALVPFIVGVGVLAAGAALVVSGLRTKEVRGLVELGAWARQGGHVLDVLLVTGGLALVIALWDRLGFLILSTLYAGLLIARFRQGRIVASIATSLALCLVIDIAFRRLLLVPLPLGPLTGWIW